MKYVNGGDILPSELLDMIQDYAQGQYVYVPKRDEDKEKWGTKTSYRKELEMRNRHIYTKFLTGLTVEQLSKNYNLSRKSINRILLCKRKEAGKMKNTIGELLQLWNINEEAHQIYDSAWTIGTEFVLKTNDNLASLKRNITIMRTLSECGIPVAKPIPTLGGQDYIEHSGKYYLLMTKLSGTHIQDVYQSDYSNIAYETGKIVARLHSAFLSCEQKITFWNNSLLDEMSGWICNTLRENQYRYLTEADFDISLKELADCYDELPRQLIHRDIHFGNILFDKGILSGYIDFDLSQKNARIFDICYFLTGLLVDHEKKKDDVEKWCHIVSRFIKGYEETNPLTKLEKDNISCLMKNIEILFVAYFISIQDEELAKSAASLFCFIKNNEKSIYSAVFNNDNAIKYSAETIAL
jgi:Ser/Thr protein kinase RdoA (MazF antagonist)